MINITNIMQNFNLSSFIQYFYLGNIQNLYLQFLAYFPVQFQPIVAIVTALLIIYTIIRIIRKDFIFIIALIILFPTSVPVLKSIWWGVVAFLQFLFHLV